MGISSSWAIARERGASERIECREEDMTLFQDAK